MTPTASELDEYELRLSMRSTLELAEERALIAGCREAIELRSEMDATVDKYERLRSHAKVINGENEHLLNLLERFESERDAAIAREKELRAELSVAWGNCHDGKCHACPRCFDAAQSEVRRLTEALAEVGTVLAKCQGERDAALADLRKALDEGYDARRERDAALARVREMERELREAREVAVRNATDCGHLRQSAIALATQLATLTRLARERVSRGHNDTCGNALGPTYPCDCGHDALAAALREQEGK